MNLLKYAAVTLLVSCAPSTDRVVASDAKEEKRVVAIHKIEPGSHCSLTSDGKLSCELKTTTDDQNH